MRYLTYKCVGNRPPRLFLSGQVDKYAVKRASLNTASWNRTQRAWSIPFDVTLLRLLLTSFPNCKISDELLNVLDLQKVHQDKVQDAIRNSEPLEKDDPLWGFQRASVRFLSQIKRGILGHDTGTGKTVVTCSALKHLSRPLKVLIVCPNAVKWSWVDHLMEWTNISQPHVLEAGNLKIETDALILMGNYDARDEALHNLFKSSTEFSLVLNYRQMTIHESLLSKYNYDVIVFDEAHRLKNRQAQQTKAAHKISERCEYVWLLTATPVRNSETDLWSLLHLADPNRFSSYWNFVNTYFQTAPGIFGGVDILGLRDTDMFNTVLSQYMFSKTKQEVLPDLPEKMPPVVYKLQLEDDQRKVYEEMEEQFLACIVQELEDGKTLENIVKAPNVVSQIIRLRQICLHPALLSPQEGEDFVQKSYSSAKIKALQEIIPDLKDANERFIVFTNFRKFIPYVEEVLKKEGVSYRLITGKQTSPERAEAQSLLTEGKIQCIIGTIQSMGEGMNLQAASVAIFCDIDWVPAVNKQAEDRIHRWGSTKPPTFIYLYHPNTVEDAIRRACERKEEIVQSTVGQVEVIRQMLRREEENQ